MFQGNRKAELYLQDVRETVLGVGEEGLAVLENLLFAREQTDKHLHCVVFPVQFEAPNILLLSAISYLRNANNTS